MTETLKRLRELTDKLPILGPGDYKPIEPGKIDCPSEDKVNGWNEWSRHVLAELERLNEEYKSLHGTLDRNKDELYREMDKKSQCVLKKLDELRDQMTVKYDQVRESVITLKVKVALIGGFAGLVVSGLITLLIRMLTK